MTQSVRFWLLEAHRKFPRFGGPSVSVALVLPRAVGLATTVTPGLCILSWKKHLCYIGRHAPRAGREGGPAPVLTAPHTQPPCGLAINNIDNTSII